MSLPIVYATYLELFMLPHDTERPEDNSKVSFLKSLYERFVFYGTIHLCN